MLCEKYYEGDRQTLPHRVTQKHTNTGARARLRRARPLRVSVDYGTRGVSRVCLSEVFAAPQKLRRARDVMQGEDGESPVVARGLLDGDAPAGPARPTREAALTVKFLTTLDSLRLDSLRPLLASHLSLARSDR